MAASNTYCLSTEDFRMPSEPCPLPSLGSDEGSFEILWKDGLSPTNEDNDPIGTSVVEEAKQLVNSELQKMEQLRLSQKSQSSLQTEHSLSQKSQENSQVEQNFVVNTQSVSQLEQSIVPPKMEQSTVFPKMEQSTVLPKMPQVQKEFDTSDVISITTISTDWTSEEVQRKVSQIIDENIRLKDTILQNNMSMKSQYERIVAWQEDVQKVHKAHKEKIIEAKEYIERLKKENFNLTRDLEKLAEIKKLQDEELISLNVALKDKKRQSNEKLIKSTDNNMKEFELDISNKKVKELELAMQNITLENMNLKEDRDKLSKDISKVEQYEKQIEALQQALHESKRQIEEAKVELLKVQSLEDEKQKSMHEVIESLRAQLAYMSQQQTMVPSPEDVDNIRQQLTNTQVMLTQVEHSRVAAYAQVAALNNEISELKKQVASQSQKDEMYALQTQLDVYKADFEAERSAKDTIRAENEKLTEDMQNLHRRNQQLQEEIEMIREHRDYDVYPSSRRERGSASASSATSNEHPKKCPKCNFGFNTFQALENHVYRCIELDDSLP